MKKSIFLFFAAILCATSASAWSYKTAANSWKTSTSGFTRVTMNSGKSMDVVMLKDVGDGVNICQNDDGNGQKLYCKWTKTSGDIFRGTARWNNGLYSDETVVVPGGKVYIKVGSGTQVQMTAGADYTYTADVTFSTTGESYTIFGGTVNGATINAESGMPNGGKPSSLTMSNSYTSTNSGSVHIVFDLRTNKVTETAESAPEPEPVADVTIYFVNTKSWPSVNAYVWDNSDNAYKAWAGEAMTLTGDKAHGYDVYSYTFPETYTNCIFNGNGQTENLVVNAGQYYDIASKTWYATLAEVPNPTPAVMETVYFINTGNWGKVNAYAWTSSNNGWPGAAMTKEAEQIAGFEVYSFTAEQGQWANLIFNNGEGTQTGDLTWQAGKYYAPSKNEWYADAAAAEAALAIPVPTYDYYIAGPLAGGWSASQMGLEKVAEGQYALEFTKDAGDYQFKVTNGKWGNEEGGFDCADVEGSYQEVSLVDGNVNVKLTATTTFTVKFDSNTKKITFEGLTEKVVVTPDVITYVLMGVGGDWTTGIALTKNETAEYGEEYVLLGQEIAEGDAVKVVTLVNGVAKAYCGAVEKASPVKFEFDNDGNIVLLPGKYDFYFKVNDPTTYEDDAMYIAGEVYPVEPKVITYELNGGVLPAPAVPTQEELWASFKTATGLDTKALSELSSPVLNTIAGLLKNINKWYEGFDVLEWKWLKSYIQTIQANQAGQQFVDANGTTRTVVELKDDISSDDNWRFAVAAFFAQSQYVGWPTATADFTEAGKPEAWGAAYQVAHAVVLPTEPVDAPYTLPTPVKEGYTFVGWYDNAEGIGEAYTVIPAGWAGTLYAIWKQGTTTALENIAVEGKAVKAIINGQLIIIKNGVQYNAQGAILK